MQPRGRQSIQHGLMQDALQLAAMDRELRHVEAGIEAAQLAPDRRAEAVHVDQLMSAHADGIKGGQEPERGQLTNGMRQAC